MAKTKFTFEKRQREIARQQKQKEKATRRSEAKELKDNAPPDFGTEDRQTNDSLPAPEVAAEEISKE